uniref:Uncharacterized protein n=1 Tax=Balaenoptera musculus TaxID=9771 RepID=A0A8C0C903_BALMU
MLLPGTCFNGSRTSIAILLPQPLLRGPLCTHQNRLSWFCDILDWLYSQVWLSVTRVQ